MHLKLSSGLGGLTRGEPSTVTIATNNGDIGGGEVMLIRIAQALERLQVGVTVVAPSGPDELARTAAALGLRTVRLPATTRREWMQVLRRWDGSERRGLLWCNGLVPAVATMGHADRIVHLHQQPGRLPRRLLASAARRGVLDTLVPSEAMRRAIPGTRVLSNWTDPIEITDRDRPGSAQVVVGFLGRLSPEKGVPVLAEAMAELDRGQPGRFRLMLAGAPRFVGSAQRDEVERALRPIIHLLDRPGWVERREFLSRIDVLVVPSTWAEPFGLVAAEAMAARVPVIVSDAGALPEVVGNESGLVVPAGDARRLADALTGLADGRLSPATEALHDRWERRFSPEAGLAGVEQVLTRLGVRHGRPADQRALTRGVPAQAGHC